VGQPRAVLQKSNLAAEFMDGVKLEGVIHILVPHYLTT
jgi:hypothetical protein